MKRIETDICIIGGGSGGLSLAAGAVQMGARVVLFEGSQMGGDWARPDLGDGVGPMEYQG